MNKTTAALTAIILVVIVLVASYGVYNLYVPSGNGSHGEIVTIVDATGAQVNVTLPVERIVSLNSGLTETTVPAAESIQTSPRVHTFEVL